MNLTLLSASANARGATRLRSGILLSLLFALLLMTGGEGLAQQPSDPCTGGRLYYIAFPDTLKNTQDRRFPDRSPESMVLMIYSPVTQEVKLENGSREQRLEIEGGTTREVEFLGFEEDTPQITVRNQPTGPVIRVEAASPIVIYAVISTRFGTAGFTPPPVDAWGTEYYSATWPGRVIRNIYPAGETNYDASEKVEAPAQIMIVAAYDNTVVSITPNADLAGCQGCTQVTLDQGEAYFVASRVDTSDEVEYQPDIAGSLIVSSKPVGVISGNTRTTIEDFIYPLLAGNSPRDLTAEWLRPVGLNGTQFVGTSTEEVSMENQNVQRIRLFPTAEPETRFEANDGSGSFRDLGVRRAPTEFEEERYQEGRGIVYRSTEPSQAFQVIAGSAQFNGTTGSGNFIGARYTAWGSAMVELVPREYWVTAAPFRAPMIIDTNNYLTVVTDTAGKDDVFLAVDGKSPVKLAFENAIAGTDVVWTTRSVASGVGYIVYSENGARFTGQVFGATRGFEMYTPGGASEKGTGSTSDAHPSEYEESIARTYAYPLVSTHCGKRLPNNYVLDTLSLGCDEVVLRLRDRNDSALNLKLFYMPDGESENVQMELISPENPLQIDTAHELIVRLSRINPDLPGRALIYYRDRTQDGETHAISHEFGPGALFATDPLVVRFEEVDEPTEGSLLLSNQTNRTIMLRALSLALQDRGFSILRTAPDVPWGDTSTLTEFGPGDTLRVWLRFDPEGRTTSVDTLLVDLECDRMALPVYGTAGEPCLFVGDLDFGYLGIGESKTLPLEICNNGTGSISFDSIPLTWELTEYFTISEPELEALKGVTLGAGDCYTIHVSFRSDEVEGDFRSDVRLWASTRQCRDTSIWRARVMSMSVGDGDEKDRYRVSSLVPNPSDGMLRLNFEVGRSGHANISLVDLEGSERKVLLSAHLTDGAHQLTFRLDDIPSGTYFLRIRSGEWEVLREVHVVR